MKITWTLAAIILPFSAFGKTTSLTETQHARHFEFRAKAYQDMKAKDVRKPATDDFTNDMASNAQRDEQRAIVKEFRQKAGSYFTIMEDLGRFGERGGNAKPDAIAKQIPDLLAKKLADKKSMSYKALRYQQISAIDGRNQEGGFTFPVEAKNINVFGPIAENVDQRERCSYDEKTDKITQCSQGWNQWVYLAAVSAESCHNSGCDTSPVMVKVSITFIPAVYDGTAYEEKANPKLLHKAYYEVKADELTDLSTIALPETSK